MIKANIITGHPNWKKFLKKPNDYLKKRLNKLSKTPSFKKKNHEFSILLTNNKEMKKLNHKFRKKKGHEIKFKCIKNTFKASLNTIVNRIKI